MTLTYGKAPFSDRPGGVFNFRREGPAAVLYWEDFPKRVRVEFNGATIADSRRVKALHETGEFMVLYFPREDVEMRYLEGSNHRIESPHKGSATHWSVRVGDRVAADAAWSYGNPAASATPIAHYVAFVYTAMDAWYQEDDRVYSHPRDPYHRFDIHNSSRRVIVRHGASVIAESGRPRILFETGVVPRYYLPPEDVRVDLLERSATVSQCPYKGDGQHWNLTIDGTMLRNAAWTLPRPLGEAQVIADCFCFYSEKLEVEVDGERLME